MVKRFADWLEKVSVAALVVGLFQDKEWGLIVAMTAFAVSMWLTKRQEGEFMNLWIVTLIWILIVGIWGTYLTRKQD